MTQNLQVPEYGENGTFRQMDTVWTTSNYPLQQGVYGSLLVAYPHCSFSHLPNFTGFMVAQSRCDRGTTEFWPMRGKKYLAVI